MTFEEFNFHPDIMKGIRDMRYTNPTPIQEQSIPPILEGRDVIANAQTGSGKTAAFILPLMNRIVDMPEGKTRILVLAPTRELACQIDEQALGFGYHTHIRSAAVYGGVRMELQEQALKDGTAIIVATPGRLLDHHKYGSWKFDELTALVFDEADRMLDMGFWPDIQAIMAKLPAKKQMLLFSATMPQPIVEMSKNFMHETVHIKIGMVRPPSTINQVFYPVDGGDKMRLLLDLVSKKDMKSSLIFVSTKIGADRLYRALHERKLSVGVIHGDREQQDRDKVLLDFRSGKVQYLVATDVASRGIDVDGITHVVNFDLPPDADTYVHRIGRTARAGEKGEAMSFITQDDEEKVRQIEAAIGKQIPREVVPGFEVTARAPRGDSYRGGSGSGGGRSSGGRPQGGRSQGGHSQGGRPHSDAPHRGAPPRQHSHSQSPAAQPLDGGPGQGPVVEPASPQVAQPFAGEKPSGPALDPRDYRPVENRGDGPRAFREGRPQSGHRPSSGSGGGPGSRSGGGQPRRYQGSGSGSSAGPGGQRHSSGPGQGSGPRHSSGSGSGAPRRHDSRGPESRPDSSRPDSRGQHRGGPSSSRPAPRHEAKPSVEPKKKRSWWPF